MKKSLHIITKVFSRIVTRAGKTSVHIWALAIVLVCAFFIALYLYANWQSNKTFDAEYAVYNTFAGQTDNTAYIPGAQTNPVRIALDQDLTLVLNQSVTAPLRLKAAAQGLVDLKNSESQIEAISSTTDKVDAQIAKMQIDSLKNPASSNRARSIIALAKDRSSIISNIRAYSYRSDFEIGQIFNTIITDKGVLTSAYVASLNGEIPQVETEFDQRSNLYAELQTTAQKIATIYAGTSASAQAGTQTSTTSGQ